MDDPSVTLISCSICMDIFRSPRMLPCQHTFCEECLSSHMKKKRITHGSRTFECPLCRKTFVSEKEPFDGSTFPLNRLVVEMTEIKNQNAIVINTKKQTRKLVSFYCSFHRQVKTKYICKSHHCFVCEKCYHACKTSAEIFFKDCRHRKTKCCAVTVVDYMESPEYHMFKTEVNKCSEAAVSLFDVLQENVRDGLEANAKFKQRAQNEIVNFKTNSYKQIDESVSQMTNQVSLSTESVEMTFLERRKTCRNIKTNIDKMRSKVPAEANTELVEVIARRTRLTEVMPPLKALATQETTSLLELDIPIQLTPIAHATQNGVYVRQAQSELKTNNTSSYLGTLDKCAESITGPKRKRMKQAHSEDQKADADDIDSEMYAYMLSDSGYINKFVIKSLMSSNISLKKRLIGCFLFIVIAKVYFSVFTLNNAVATYLVYDCLKNIFFRASPTQIMKRRSAYRWFRLIEHICNLTIPIIYVYLSYFFLIRSIGPETFIQNLEQYTLDPASCSIEQMVLVYLFGDKEMLVLKSLQDSAFNSSFTALPRV